MSGRTTVGSAPEGRTWVDDPGSGHAVALTVLRHGPLSRSDLARRLGLSAGSLTRLTAPLVERGVLVEQPARAGAGAGRPTRPVEVVGSRHHFVGVKVTGDEVYAVLCDLRAEVLTDLHLPLTGSAPEEVATRVAEAAGTVADGHHPAALGLALGGACADHRVVTRAPFLGWTARVDLASLVGSATGLPTTVENDLVALTRTEHWFGAGRGLDHFVLVTIGSGVGHGLVVHDQVVDTADAGVGLLGHLPVDPYGPRCTEGHRGCASAVLSSNALAGAVSAGLGRAVDHEEALGLAAAGDPVAAPVVAEAGRALGVLLGTAANAALTPTVLLSGEGVGLVDVAGEEVRAALRATRPEGAAPVDLRVDRTGFREWARAAAVSAIQRFVLAS